MNTKQLIAAASTLSATCLAQPVPSMGAAATIDPHAQTPGITPAGPIVAGLQFDHTSPIGFAGQLFESNYDLYDSYIVEDFVLDHDASLGEFQSHAFGDGNPNAVLDVIAEIAINDMDAMCSDDGPTVLLRSIPGAGYFADSQAVTDFGQQCLPAGDYLIRWAARLDFQPHGQIWFYEQFGDHTHGRGKRNSGRRLAADHFGDGWLCVDCDNSQGEQTGVNFVLYGAPSDCDAPCDLSPCGDLDFDGDSDADDFFKFLDLYTSQDPCADIDQDTDLDADDFFGYLDLFVTPC